MNKFNHNFPYYEDDSDYNTNANSYYKYLGRKTKLIKLLAKRIWEYDERLDNRLEELEIVLNDYLSQWDKRIDELDEEVSHIFVEWLNDGTLEQIINHDVLGNKADKTYVDELNDELGNKADKTYVDELNENVTTDLTQTTLDYLNLGKEKNDGVEDNHQDLINLMDQAHLENKGLYIPNGTFYVSEDLEITGFKNIIIDGTIKMAEGKMLEMSYDSFHADSVNWVVNTVQGKLRLTGLKNAIVKINKTNELELFANGDVSTKSSIAYSQFHLGYVDKLSIDSMGSKVGWINENIFYGGRIHELIIDGNYNHNNNTFIQPMMERSSLAINKGRSNNFYDVRFEYENEISFAEGTLNNYIQNKWMITGTGMLSSVFSGSGRVLVTDNGNNFFVRGAPHKSETLYTLNKFNNPPSLPVEQGKVVIPAFERIIETGLIPINQDTIVGIDIISSGAGIRPVIFFYDENENQIIGDDPEIVDSARLSWSSSYNRYDTSSNDNPFITFTVDTSKFKYMEFRMSYGFNTEIESLEIVLNYKDHVQVGLIKDGFKQTVVNEQ